MSITLHPTITINEAQYIAKMLDCQVIPDQRNPGDYVITPRIVRHDGCTVGDIVGVSGMLLMERPSKK